MQGVIGTRYPQPRMADAGRRGVRVPGLRGLGEILIVGIATLLYFAVRGLVHDREAEAFANARRLVDVERALGVFWEPAIQQWALETGPVRTVANWVYIWGHWPVIITTLLWLLTRHRDAYGVYRNALLLSGALGLVVFTLFPMAPPRFMADLGFVDTITLHSNSYRVLQPPSLVNQYAAMPSLHVGWDLLMGIAIFRHAPGRLRLLGVVFPVAMFLAVVLTANHYLADGIVGSAIVLAALWLVRTARGSLPAIRPRPTPARAAHRI